MILRLYVWIRATFRISYTVQVHMHIHIYISVSRYRLSYSSLSDLLVLWTRLVSVVLHRHRRVAFTSYRFLACTYDVDCFSGESLYIVTASVSWYIYILALLHCVTDLR